MWSSTMSLKLRLATTEDTKTIFLWRNDPWIVSLSASQRTVSWEEHIRWFTKVLNQDNHLLFVIEFKPNNGIGSIRLDYEQNQRAIVTIYILRPFVGRGLGVVALSEACHLGFSHWSSLLSIHAYIRSDNSPSIRAFSKAGFNHVNPIHIELNNQVEMVMYRQKF